MSTREIRFKREKVDATEQGEQLVLEGYAAKFDTPYLIRGDEGDFWEIVRPGAFKRSLELAAAGGRELLALNGHDSKFVIGNTANGTLALFEDEIGLRCRMTLPPTTDARDLLTRVRLGYVNGMSHGFDVDEPGERFEWRNGRVERDLLDLDLFEVTVTAIPANEATDVWASQRAKERAKELRERSAALRSPAAPPDLRPIAWALPPR